MIYQSGYLTIKDYDREFRLYRLGFPNDEVRYGFLNFLLPFYTAVTDEERSFYIGKFVQELRTGNVDAFMHRFEAFFADFPYELNDQTERHYQVIIYLIFKLMGQFTQAEVHSSRGRADAVVRTPKFIYIFEFKLNGTVEQAMDNITYVPAQELLLVGKATTEGEYFHRVDTAKYCTMPPTVKKLFTNSAGLAISFTTNSPVIKAKWMVPDNYQLPNLTRVAQKGLDLYIKRDGKWQFAGVGIPGGVTTEKVLVDNMGTEEKECLLYLPLYDELKSLEIGVSSDAHIRKGENPFKEKIVVYGSSILQGASASRPGMAYPARLSRSSGYNFINLGLSGNGKMEKEVAEMLADIDADAFILDCIPNPSPKEITDRTVDFVMTLRQKHPDTPIIVIQTLIRETGNFNQKARENVKRQNEAIAEQVEVLRKKNVKNLYFIKEDQFLGTDHEGTVDGTHPNDLGFDRMLKKYKPAISKILKIKFKTE